MKLLFAQIVPQQTENTFEKKAEKFLSLIRTEQDDD
jgi:hypothetical protein